jgi:hypothetical protein
MRDYHIAGPNVRRLELSSVAVLLLMLSGCCKPFARAQWTLRFDCVSPISGGCTGGTVGLPVPFVCNETHELGEELVGSYRYQVHLLHWLESNNYGVFLSDNDLYI